MARQYEYLTRMLLVLAAAIMPSSLMADEQQLKAHPLDPALEVVHQCLQHSRANIKDYTAVLIKRLRTDGTLTPHQFMSVKIRNGKAENEQATPMGVYLKFLRPNSVRGREVIWVEGQNRGKLIVHETGLKRWLRVSLDPTGYVAMRGQRYPISDIGIENLAVKMIETAERDRQFDECQVQLVKNAKIGDRSCTMIEVMHPVKRPHFDFHRARVYIDNEHNLPVRYASWSWPRAEGDQPVLEEEYTYVDVKLNVGLSDHDFNPDNPDYDFP